MEIPNIQSGQPFASKGRVGASTDSAANTAQSVRDNLSSPKEVQSGGINTDELTKAPLTQQVNAELKKENSSQGLSQDADNQGEERNTAKLEEAVTKVESFLTIQNRDLIFSIDENTNRSVVTVKDGQSGDVIRQIPSEELLKLAERIQELQQDVGNSVGVFINNQV
ncbi:MAG: flagellar protein FlaG [Gammaproteobacteria bacterium]|nr:flagellar protein FlaG [Gammaproteobacteria bacterium]